MSFASLANVSHLEQMHELYERDSEKLDPSWIAFFEGMEFGALGTRKVVLEEASRDIRIFQLIDAYRTHGHLMAKINPIATQPPKLPADLALESLGFQTSELKELFPTCGLLKQEEAPLEKIVATLQTIYSSKIGIEYMGYQTPKLEKWLQSQIEPTRFRPNFSIEKKHKILHDLNKSELFEIFLHTKYVGQKRFSLEGGETLIPILTEIIEVGADTGMDEFVIGMAHRGRLNVLTNVMNKSYSMVFSEFDDFYDPELTEASGDVKYHKGYSSDIITQNGHGVHISLAANPSHLESVAPVVLGKVRAKQIHRKDEEKKKVIPIVIHGDAAVAGQGVVYESMQLYRLGGYGTGGTIHIVINNQIGFTTLPKDSRSTSYCTAISRTFSAPVFHVNAEDPEGCILATGLAVQLRQRFGCDVFIDMNCYRKYGHNESDEPFFTQPLEYGLINKKKSIREIYRDELIHHGMLEKRVAKEGEAEFSQGLHHELEELKIKKEKIPDEAFSGVWKDYKRGVHRDIFKPVVTAVSKDILREVLAAFSRMPQGFAIHPKVEKLIGSRRQMVEGKGIDWGCAEHLAFGSLLWEGVHIRLSGQDSRRGTFSQRHAVIVDQKNSQKYAPLSHMKPNQGRFDVFDSPLSEFGVLGFEFGYSLSYPSALVLWEAQFGDFANGAQVIIDQYVSCSEQKWARYSGLVMLLPHGYEGQGPEHSSARIERFLQLAAEANVQVVTPSTPAQYFHLLRRQVIRVNRKPLIVFTPKGLLRHPMCKSELKDLATGTFNEILDDPARAPKAHKLLICTGRIYYDLVAEREKRKMPGVSILRIEQLYPIQSEKLKEILMSYKGVEKVCFVQEEPSNMGAWSAMEPILRSFVTDVELVGRSRAASPATGSHSAHKKEHDRLMDMAFQTQVDTNNRKK